MSIKTILRAALAATTILGSSVALCGAAGADGFSSLTVFGDSLSDSGNIPAVLGGANFPPDPPFVGNRFSNGPTYAEQLPALLGIAPGNVMNFALGGAFSGQLTVAPGVTSGNLNALPPRNLLPLSPLDTRTQVTNFLATAPAIGGNDLFIVFAGGNDAFITLNAVAGDPANAITIIGAGTGTAAANIRAAATDLINAGARQIILPNLPDVGDSPDAVATGPSGVQAANLFSTLLNSATLQVANDLNSTTPAMVFVIDNFSITKDIVANPAKYGFANTNLSCIDTPSCVFAPVDTQNTFLSFDGTHPTTAGHAILAAVVADTINAPQTVAAQAETGRILGESFGRELLGLGAAGGNQLSAAIGYQGWDRDSSSQTMGYDISSIRFTASGSWEFTDQFHGGVAMSYDDGDVDIDSISAGFDIETFRIGAFMGVSGTMFDVNASLAHGFDNYNNIRRTSGVAGQTANASTNGSTTTLMVEMTKRYEFGSADNGSWGIAPAFRIGYARAKVDGYTESGAVGLNQSVASRSSKTFFGEMGARFDASFESGGGMVQPWIGVMYHTVLDDKEQSVKTSLATVSGVVRRSNVDAPDDDYARVDGGVSIAMGGGMTFALSAEAIVAGSDLSGFGANARIGWNF